MAASSIAHYTEFLREFIVDHFASNDLCQIFAVYFRIVEFHDTLFDLGIENIPTSNFQSASVLFVCVDVIFEQANQCTSDTEAASESLLLRQSSNGRRTSLK